MITNGIIAHLGRLGKTEQIILHYKHQCFSCKTTSPLRHDTLGLMSAEIPRGRKEISIQNVLEEFFKEVTSNPCSPAEWTCVYLEARGSHQDWEILPTLFISECLSPFSRNCVKGDDGLYQLNCDYKVGDEYGAPDPPFSIHIGDTWRRSEQGKGPQVKDRACYYCKRPGHIQRDCSLYNRGQYRKPEDKKFGKLGLCLSEHENKQHTEGGRPDLYTSAALVKLPGVSTGDTKDVDDNSVPGLDISRGSVGDSPFADVILGNVIDKIEKMEVEKPADCLAVQTRAQIRLEAEETKPRPKKTDDAIDILGGVYESMDYDSEFNDRASPSLELQKGAEDVIFSDTLSNTQKHVVVTKIGKFSLLCSFPNVCHHFQGDDGLYQLNCDYKVGDEYGAPDPPFSIHIGDTWRRCTCMVYGDRERSTLETLVYVCCVVVS
uniref:CCHC-type domain-containing protein n=1 Tax=Magallana gigas TaxID=29159 RepID=A0A8W8MBY5_MAGGI